MKFQIQDFIINNVDYGVNYRLKFTVPGIAYFLIYLKETEKGVSAMCDAVKDLVDEFVEDEKKETAKKTVKDKYACCSDCRYNRFTDRTGPPAFRNELDNGVMDLYLYSLRRQA